MGARKFTELANLSKVSIPVSILVANGDPPFQFLF